MKIPVLTLIQEIATQLNHIYEQKTECEQVAWWLLQTIAKKTKASLIAQETIELSKDENNRLQKAITQHCKDLKPLQYIIGWVPFLDLSILVAPPTLIPRPETEEWTANLIEQLKKNTPQELSILDIATGSGCIALALAQAFPNAHIVATDISEQALTLAKENAKHNKIHNVTFIKSNIYTSIPHSYTFDLIVSNPPYIAPNEWESLSPMVRKWEDKKALIAPQDGLEIIYEIIDKAQEYLKKNRSTHLHTIPQLVIEIGWQQGPLVKKHMEEHEFKRATIVQDLEGKDRIVTGAL